MAIAAADAADRVEQLIILTERLTDLVAEQALAFEQHRAHEVAPQLEEATRLANLYRHESARVRADPTLVASAGLERRTRLVRATEAFDAVLARQERALAAAKHVTEGLVRAIADEVAAQRSRGATYGPTAAAPTGSASAITLNKRA
jgi:hypothetical protein